MQLISRIPVIQHRRSLAVVGAVVSLLLSTIPAFGLEWRKSAHQCEPPWKFYSESHRTGKPPCCPMLRCPGETTCVCNPGSSVWGVCKKTGQTPYTEQYRTKPVGCRCDLEPLPPDNRKNVVMFVTDDQASCAYGHAGTCYSIQNGFAIPAPVTPELDDLAARGTTFPIVHNTAAYCHPSLRSILTSRYQRNMGKVSNPSDVFATLPSVLRAATLHARDTSHSNEPPTDLDGPGGSPIDPYENQTWQGGNVVDPHPAERLPINRIGGYCTYFGGKLGPGHANARGKGKQEGKLECDEELSAEGKPTCGSRLDPSSGSAVPGRPVPYRVRGMENLFEFIDAMILEFQVGDPEKAQPGRWQRFFAWHFPFIPHRPLVTEGHPTVRYLFGAEGTPGLFEPGDFPQQSLGEGEQQRSTKQYYGSVFMADENLRLIREHLARRGLDQDTVIIHVSDNPWFMLRSKKNATENGYRTRLIVYDPAYDPDPDPDGDPDTDDDPGPPRQNFEAVHSNDILPTVLNYATLERDNGTARKTVDCPASPEAGRRGTSERCDGLDLATRLFGTNGLVDTTDGVRDHLCGHLTKKVSSPEKKRFLVTGHWRTGRCLPPAGTACSQLPWGFNYDVLFDSSTGSHATFAATSAGTEAECTNEGGRCCPGVNPARRCPEDPPSPPSCAEQDKVGICLMGKCRAAPPCVAGVDEDGDAWDSCQDLFPEPPPGEQPILTCAVPSTATQGWCVADPNKQCASADDCPYQDKTCTPSLFKVYLGAPKSGGTVGETDVPELAMTNLLLDPNERQVAPSSGNAANNFDLGAGDDDGILARRDPGTIAHLMSGGGQNDPYENTRKRLSCCVERWWNGDEEASRKGYCSLGYPCPMRPVSPTPEATIRGCGGEGP